MIPGGIGGALTRKIGPLPAWGWGVGIGGALLAVKLVRGGGAKKGGAVDSETQTVLVPTGAPSIPHDYIGQLGQAVSEIRDKLGGIGERLDDLEVMPGPGETPETPTPPASPAPPPPSAAPTTPVSAKPPIAHYNPATGVWTFADWSKVSREQVIDKLFADVLGRGPNTGEESNPWIQRATAMFQAGVSNLNIYNTLAPALAPYRSSALAGNPVPPPQTMPPAAVA